LKKPFPSRERDGGESNLGLWRPAKKIIAGVRAINKEAIYLATLILWQKVNLHYRTRPLSKTLLQRVKRREYSEQLQNTSNFKSEVFSLIKDLKKYYKVLK
jgi:hypothetical protein